MEDFNKISNSVFQMKINREEGNIKFNEIVVVLSYHFQKNRYFKVLRKMYLWENQYKSMIVKHFGRFATWRSKNKGQ